MNMRRGAIWFLWFIPLAVLAAHYVYRLFTIDYCLDHGDVFDYTKGTCRFDVTTLPFVAYSAQYWPLVLGTVLLSAALMGWALVRGSSRLSRS